MISSTFAHLASSNVSIVTTNSRTSDDVGHRLLVVIAGGEEFLLRPEFIRGVYTIPVECMTSDLSSVPTPEGMIPAVSLAKRMASELGFCPRNEETERTVIVFQQDDRSVALRVHSVSRPIVVDHHDVFPLPELALLELALSNVALSCDTTSCLDSVVVMHDKQTKAQKRIGLIVNPMIVLGFCDTAIPLSGSGLHKPTWNQLVREQGNETSRPQKFGLANTQVLAFSPRTPLPAHLFFRFCLPMSIVAEVLLDEPYMPLPTASSILLGVLIWRSIPVPVIDLAKAFGASENETHQTQPGRILIAKLPGGRFVALPTESSIQVKRAPKSTSVRYPAIAGYPNLGAFPDGSDLLVLPDINRILRRS